MGVVSVARRDAVENMEADIHGLSAKCRVVKDTSSALGRVKEVDRSPLQRQTSDDGRAIYKNGGDQRSGDHEHLE